nr:coat protein duplicate 1 [Grapevine leafroll-associated virus 1]UTM04054.1 coat protein duplicate 1 [Grapevine leafroll-associated virus 1]
MTTALVAPIVGDKGEFLSLLRNLPNDASLDSWLPNAGRMNDDFFRVGEAYRLQNLSIGYTINVSVSIKSIPKETMGVLRVVIEPRDGDILIHTIRFYRDKNLIEQVYTQRKGGVSSVLKSRPVDSSIVNFHSERNEKMTSMVNKQTRVMEVFTNSASLGTSQIKVPVDSLITVVVSLESKKVSCETLFELIPTEVSSIIRFDGTVDYKEINRVRKYIFPYKTFRDSKYREVLTEAIAARNEIAATQPETEAIPVHSTANVTYVTPPEGVAITNAASPDVKPIDEVATLLSAIENVTDLPIGRSKLNVSELDVIELTGYYNPSVMDVDDVRYVNTKLLDYFSRLYGKTESSNRALAIGMIQGALTWSTSANLKDSENRKVDVSLNGKNYTVDFNELRQIIRSSVPPSKYDNPVRQYMRWFSTTTISLIKSGVVVPNYHVMARHGVTSQFIPYGFDYCILLPSYNRRDDKVAAALARAQAVALANKRRAGKTLYNFSELEKS